MRQEGILGNWALDTLTPKDLEDATDNLIKKATDQYDKVGSLKPEELNIENCVQVNISHLFLQGCISHLFFSGVLNWEDGGSMDLGGMGLSRTDSRMSRVVMVRSEIRT